MGELIDQQGFQGSYDFLYLPFSFQTETNQGFAFINFTSTENFDRFREHLSGFNDWKFPSDSICELMYSDKFVNLDDYVNYYRNTSIMHESVEERFKPALFKNGLRVPF